MPRPQPVDVTVRRLVDASPETLYDLVSDITRMPEWSPETIATTWLDGAEAAAVGVRFSGRNRLGGLQWTTKPTITAAERGRRFAFKVPGGSGTQWTYTFEAVGDATLVTESAVQAKRSPLPIRLLQRRAGVTDRAASLHGGITTTLERLSEAAVRLERQTATGVR